MIKVIVTKAGYRASFRAKLGQLDRLVRNMEALGFTVEIED